VIKLHPLKNIETINLHRNGQKPLALEAAEFENVKMLSLGLGNLNCFFGRFSHLFLDCFQANLDCF
jgi:hypothetical protein